MKWLGSRRIRWIGGLAALAMGLVSCFANSVQILQDQQKVATMSTKMKTICVGRFLVDLPVEAQVNISHGYTGGFHLSSVSEESDGDFAARIQNLEDEFAAARSEDGRPYLQSAKFFRNGSAQGKVFVYNRRRGETLVNNKVVELEDVSVQGLIRFEGLSVIASADYMALDVGERLDRLLRQIRPLDGNELPRERGFCIDHAIVSDPIDDADTEKVVMFAGLPGHPDVNIVLSSMAGTDPAPGLLERHARSAERLPLFVRMASTDLRAGKRIVNGLTGDEVGIRIREPNFTTGYSFRWEMRGKQDDIYAPVLALELVSGANPVNGGKPVQSTLSEDAMTALWERVVSSIRIRPTEPRRTTVAAEASAALGTSVLAGDVCPETGWWRCAEGGHGTGVFGGERQFLKKGQRVPQALLLPPATLWQRLRGMQPSYESANRTTWTLADKRSNKRVPSPCGLEQALPGPEAGAVPAGASPAASIEAPIGSVAKTGAACPASGWWCCEDGHALDGTRWFAAGSLLPAATFRTQVHGHGAGQPGLIHRRSAWQLVRHAEAPADGGAPSSEVGLSGRHKPRAS
ncbi:T6SS immunity protein Tli4 family protein [Massilia sp. ZL223]|uniref:T6SS immunity protein Tli4 family protein n=1 Tax=Massilia sp. ZL223 TaxID=2824904 RepID=UPI001B80F47D|nr:T6SS immunity protein Tli4 family protein [Massilia sp. ZL223]MBQ5963255.1 hypothetical protein [Massilia sp. ZL223]